MKRSSLLAGCLCPLGCACLRGKIPVHCLVKEEAHLKTQAVCVEDGSAAAHRVNADGVLRTCRVSLLPLRLSRDRPVKLERDPAQGVKKQDHQSIGSLHLGTALWASLCRYVLFSTTVARPFSSFRSTCVLCERVAFPPSCSSVST